MEKARGAGLEPASTAGNHEPRDLPSPPYPSGYTARHWRQGLPPRFPGNPALRSGLATVLRPGEYHRVAPAL